jgi:hypothetical protein
MICSEAGMFGKAMVLRKALAQQKQPQQKQSQQEQKQHKELPNGQSSTMKSLG